jgi:hypothetical protein
MLACLQAEFLVIDGKNTSNDGMFVGRVRLSLMERTTMKNMKEKKNNNNNGKQE